MKASIFSLMKVGTAVACLWAVGMLCPQAAQAQGTTQTFTQEQLKAYFDLRPTPDKWVDPTGKYPVVMEVDPTLADHTIYHPVDLSAFPKKDRLPVVLMSGPGCDDDGDSFRPFWTEIASHGYLVIATDEPVPDGVRAAMGATTEEDMKAGIDWILAENQRPGSKYYQKVDTRHIALFGQSCGGVQALKLAGDPRVSLLGLWNSGLGAMADNADPTRSSLMGITPAVKELLIHLTIPIAYFVGDTDAARPNAAMDYDRIQSPVPVVYAVREIPGDAHGGTFREKNGGSFGQAGVAWLDWQFKRSKKAAKIFKSTKSLLYTDKKWVEVKTKNLK